MNHPTYEQPKPPLCLNSDFFFAVYLNVTNIETYNVGHDKFCIKWTPHRAATSYRIKLNPADRKSPQITF